MAVIPTRINSSGTFLVNGDFDEVTFNTVNPVIKNAFVYTESFNAGGWALANISITQSATTAPNGTLTATKFIDTVSSNHYILLDTSITAGTRYVQSVFVKSAEITFFHLSPSSGFTTTDNWVNFDLTAGTYSIQGLNTLGATAGIIDAGNGWWRCWMSLTAQSTTLGRIAFGPTSSLTAARLGAYTGNGINGLYVWGAQIEVGSIPTIYQGITAAETLVTPTFANKTTTSTYYVTGNFDEVTYNSTTPVIKNLISYSQDFTQWSKNTAPNDYTVVSDSELAPDVTQTADLIIKSTGVGSSSIVYKLFSGIPNTEYCGSIYVKAGGYSKVSVRFGNTAFANQNIGGNFDLVTGTVNSILNGSTVTINSAENGWWRISITATSDNDGGNYVFAWVPLDDAYNANFTGNGTSGVYAWGAQVEIGSTATIYQGIAATNTLVNPGFAKRETSDGSLYVTDKFDEVTGMITTDGLAGYWDIGKLESYVPGNTNLTDISGGTKNGTPSGSVTYSSANGGYLSFSGAAFYDCPLGFVYTTTPLVDRTIAAWYRCTSSSAQNQGIIVLFNGNDNTQFEINLIPAGTSISVSNNQSAGTAGVAVSLNTWYYVVGTESHSGGIRTLNLYLNGSLVATRSDSLAAYSYTADRVRLGCQKSGFPRTLLGDISNAQFYTKALSAAEVTNNFEALRDRFGI